MHNKIAFVLLMVLICAAAQSQQRFSTGLIIDSAIYSAVPMNARLMRGDYDNIPNSFSMKAYAPLPGNQGYYGTCTGWASAYAGHTILNSMKNNLDSAEINQQCFSPSFVYNQVRKSSDCMRGALLTDALDILKAQGGLYLSDFGYDCGLQIGSKEKEKASGNKIIEYRQVACKYTSGNQSYLVKKSLAERKPVVIAMDVAPSFFNAGELWKPDSSEYKDWNQGHAITVIGYDDEKFGGAFELMNSWGTNWGKDGFTWIKYSDFNVFCLFAYEIIELPLQDTSKADLSGSLIFRESNGEIMSMNANIDGFQTANAYPTGALFELRITNNEPAYVYAFSYDTLGVMNRIFPLNEKTSPFLPYKQNNIAIPDEDNYNMLDSVPGISYFCFLYSKVALPIEELFRKIQNGSGGFVERLNKALANKLVLSGQLMYEPGSGITFAAKSKGRTVLPVVIGIRHK